MTITEIIYDDGAGLSIIQSKKAAVIGYGSQGHAHVLDLKDSGADVVVGLRPGSSSWEKAETTDLEVKDVPEVIKKDDVVMILVPGQVQRFAYTEQIVSNLKPDMALFLSHSFNIRYGYIVSEKRHDIRMVAPKGPSHTVRCQFQGG